MANDNKQLGHVNRFFVANGLSQLKDDTYDISPYSGFNAELGSDFDENEFSYIGGRRRRGTKRRTATRGTTTRGTAPRRTATRGTATRGTAPRRTTTSRNQTNTRTINKMVRQPLSYTPIGMGIEFVKNLSSPEAIRRRQQLKAQAQANQSKIIAGANANDPLLNQLQQTNVNVPSKTPMKTSTKILIGVGSLALLGTIAFVVYKKLKK